MTNLTRRVALYGGSFNPPHIGHTAVIAYTLSVARIDEVWLVPCFTHAFEKALAPFEARFQMCQLLIQPFTDNRVSVSRVEERIGGVSHTIDTVHYLMKENPTFRFDLVLGTDLFRERFEWKCFDELEQLCDFIVIGREEHPAPPGIAASPNLVTVSSTEIRQSIAAGQSPKQLIPRDVDKYIEQHGLYR